MARSFITFGFKIITMKNVLYTLFCLPLLLISCESIQEESQAETKENTSPQSTQGVLTKVTVKRPDQYSLEFIEALEQESGYKTIHLVDSLMILDSQDTVLFPIYPAVGELVELKRVKDNLTVSVQVKRVSQSTVQYRTELLETGKEVNREEGRADLNPFFFFGAESDANDSLGTNYSCTEFARVRDSCETVIRIGRDEQNKYVGKLVKNCNGKVRVLGLDDSPTLFGK